MKPTPLSLAKGTLILLGLTFLIIPSNNVFAQISCPATGGTISIDGDYCVHTFTSSGIFFLPTGSVSADILVIGGGGGGGGDTGGGGGGGGYRYVTSFPIMGSTTVTVGAGGYGGQYSSHSLPTNGENSVFSTIIAAGGGAGAMQDNSITAGSSGGSGGGGMYVALPGGNGNTPAKSPSQGNNGGVGFTDGSSYFNAGGGGGAGSVGGDGTSEKSGDGGSGTSTSISGISVTYAGGGGGGADAYRSKSAGAGGTGGGGAGGDDNVNSGRGADGTANTGGGGGGGSNKGADAYWAGNGGSGVVIVRYLATPQNSKPVAYYRLNGNTMDSSGNGNNGTNYAAGTTQSGKLGGAYTFNNTANIDAPISDSLSITDTITVSAWIKAEAWRPNWWDGEIAGTNYVTGPSNSTGYVLRSGDNGTLSFTVSVNGVIDWKEARTTQGAMSTGQWYHVVGTYDGTNPHVYINGVDATSVKCLNADCDTPLTPTAMSASNHDFQIGNDGWGRYFDGSIDEVSVWNRNLSANEIAGMYNGGDGNILQDEVPIGDPGAPTNVRRISGDRNDFVLGWDAPVDNGGTDINNYIIYTSPDGGGWSGFYTNSTSTSYTFSPGSFLPNEKRYFRVKSNNSADLFSLDSATFDYTFAPGTSYTVSSCEDLNNIRNDLFGVYSIDRDIDCSMTNPASPLFNSEGPWGGPGTGQGFYPIGDTASRFKGSLEGNNHKISGLFTNLPGTSYLGLFSVIDEGSSVSNLGLEGINITGYDYVGGLAGALSGTITNVHTTGSVSGNSYVGGLVGIHTAPGNIDNSSPLVYTWNGSKYKYVADVGQMILRSNSGLDLAAIDSQDLVPRDGKYSMKISEEYNEVVYYDELSLMTFDHQPGYTVVSPLNRDTQIKDLRTISNTPTNPLIGCTDKYGNNCLDSLKDYDDKWSYKDKSFVNQWVLDFGNLANKDNIQLVMRGARDFAASASGNFEKIRDIEVKDAQGNWVKVYDKNNTASDGTPRLRTLDLTGKFKTNDYRVRVTFGTLNVNYFAIDTSPQVPFAVHTYHPTKADLQFQGFTDMDKTYYYNHDYSKISSTPNALFVDQSGNFTKYGDVSPLLQSTNDQFVVMHYGDAMDVEFPYVAPAEGLERSYILNNNALYKHATNDNIGDLGKTVDPLPYQGMTKYDTSTTYPLTPENSDYLKTWNTRVILGSVTSHGSTVINSYSTTNVNGNSFVGGLVGNNNKEIRGSYATGHVTCFYYYCGGLVGQSESNGIIKNSYETGDLTAGSDYTYHGGLVGMNYGIITNSYATGNVSGGEVVGGLIGWDNTCPSCGVNNSFSTGDVSARDGASFVGGFIGEGTEFNYITGNGGDTTGNNFWFNTTQTEGLGDRTDGATKVESVDYFKGTNITTKAPFVGYWDFASSTIWFTRDSDYPKLDALPVVLPPVVTQPVVHTSSGSSVQSQVKNLLDMGNNKAAEDLKKQFPHLFGLPTGSIPNSLVGFTFIRNMTMGAKSNDVNKLQILLNSLGHTVSLSGPGSSGKETDKFGGLTRTALAKFQKANGISPSIGFFGPVTRAFVNKLLTK